MSDGIDWHINFGNRRGGGGLGNLFLSYLQFNLTAQYIKLSLFIGEHKEKRDGQSIHRTFCRSITLPDGLVKESIKCNVDEKGIDLKVLCSHAQGPNAAG